MGLCRTSPDHITLASEAPRRRSGAVELEARGVNFAPLNFIDASRMTASYVTKYKVQLKDGEIILRDGGKDLPVLGEWKSAKNVLSTIRSSAAPLLDGKPAFIEGAKLVSLGVNERRDWDDPPKSPGAWLWLSLLPSPAAMLFSGIESHNPPVGQLTAVARNQPFAAINLGRVPAVFLVLDARAP